MIPARSAIGKNAKKNAWIIGQDRLPLKQGMDLGSKLTPHGRPGARLGEAVGVNEMDTDIDMTLSPVLVSVAES
jgi:hypothetical protein